MEFVRVVFPDARGVEVDGIVTGQTNKTFMLQAGTYRFSLDGDRNYIPPSIVAPITGTTPLTPAILTFVPTLADLAAEVGVPATSPAHRRRVGGGSTGKAKKRKPSKKSSKKRSGK